MLYFHTLVVHASHLTYREGHMSTTLQILQTMCKKHGYTYRMHMIQDYDPEQVKKEWKELEKSMDYHKIGEEDFDRGVQPLNVEQTSNFLKQRAALEKVVQLERFEKEGDKHFYFLMEDDCMILPEFMKHLELFFLQPEAKPWDILFLCASLPGPAGSYDFHSIRTLTKILPSKEAYCIRPAAARSLLQHLQKINYFYRLQLSAWIHQNPSIQAMFPSLRISLEGSKVGFVPSTVIENNVLIYNQEFMEMLHMMTGKEPMDLAKARKLYKTVEHIQSPEIMHLYGVILFKHEKKDQAKEIFLDAVQQMVLKNGCLTARSELLNNAINIHGMCQDDLEVHQRNPSKYAHVVF